MVFNQSDSTSKPQIEQPQSNLYLSDRLAGQDGRLDLLFNLFEQLQLATVETCNPTLDILTFSETAYYFAVIMKKDPSSKSVKKDELAPSQSETWTNKRKIPTSPDFQAKVFIENSSDSQGKSSKLSFLSKYKRTRHDGSYPEAQVTNENEGIMRRSSNFEETFAQRAVTTQQTSKNLWSDYNNTEQNLWLNSNDAQSTSEVDLVDLPVDDIVFSKEEAIGLVYLVDLASSTDDPLRAQELNIGIILEPHHRGQGYAHQVIDMVLEVAFETAKCHRVQAILPDHVAKDHAICLFTQMRFDHEGTRRRAFFSPMECVYKDVTYMGMLDTDWMLRQTDHKRAQRPKRLAPRSVWDELLARHQREREELLNWEAGIKYPEASRPRAQTPTQSSFRTIKANNEHDDEMGDETSGSDTSASNSRKSKEEKVDLKTLPREYESDPFATSSDSDISERSASPGGYFSAASSSDSTWDVVEPSDSDFDSSASSFDSRDEESFEFVRNAS